MDAERADNQRDGVLGDFRILLPRPEALNIKLLKRLAREFEPALACFGNFLRRVHDVEISPFARSEQAGNSPSGLLELVVPANQEPLRGAGNGRSFLSPAPPKKEMISPRDDPEPD